MEANARLSDMSLINQSSNGQFGVLELEAFNQLKQIFPNHEDVVIRRVLETCRNDDNTATLLPRCIDELVSISPSSDWATQQTKKQGVGQLSWIQKDVVNQLCAMFPHIEDKQIKVSIRHPSNTFEPLSVPTLLQRCIDDLLDGRTAPDICFLSDDEKEEETVANSGRNVPNSSKQSWIPEPIFKGQTKRSIDPETSNQTVHNIHGGKSAASTATSTSDVKVSDSLVNQTICSNGALSRTNLGKPTAQNNKDALASRNKMESATIPTQQAVVGISGNQTGSDLKQSAEGKLRQERFSCMDFSDSDSDDISAVIVKDEILEPDDDLPKISLKNRDTDSYPLVPKNFGYGKGGSNSGKQYLFPSKFTLPSSKPALNAPRLFTSNNSTSTVTSSGAADVPVLKKNLSATSAIGLMSLSDNSSAQGSSAVTPPQHCSMVKDKTDTQHSDSVSHGSTGDPVFTATPITATGDSVVTATPITATGDSVVTATPITATSDFVVTVTPTTATGDPLFTATPITATSDFVVTATPPTAAGDSLFTAIPLPAVGDSVITDTPLPAADDSVITATPIPPLGKAAATTDTSSNLTATSSSAAKSTTASLDGLTSFPIQQEQSTATANSESKGSLNPKPDQVHARPVPSLFTASRAGSRQEDNNEASIKTSHSPFTYPTYPTSSATVTSQGSQLPSGSSIQTAGTSSANIPHTTVSNGKPRPADMFGSLFGFRTSSATATSQNTNLGRASSDKTSGTSSANIPHTAASDGKPADMFGSLFGSRTSSATATSQNTNLGRASSDKTSGTSSANIPHTAASNDKPKSTDMFGSPFDENYFTEGFRKMQQDLKEFESLCNGFRKQKSTSTTPAADAGYNEDAGWWRPQARKPIVIKEVPRSCMTGPEASKPGLTLQNTIPLHAPGNKNTTVTIESLHRITYQGTKPAHEDGHGDMVRPGPSAGTPNQRRPTWPRKVPEATVTSATADRDVIELTDDSSNDSVLSQDVIIDGVVRMDQPFRLRDDSPMEVDRDDNPTVVVLDDSYPEPVQVNLGEDRDREPVHLNLGQNRHPGPIEVNLVPNRDQGNEPLNLVQDRYREPVQVNLVDDSPEAHFIQNYTDPQFRRRRRKKHSGHRRRPRTPDYGYFNAVPNPTHTGAMGTAADLGNPDAVRNPDLDLKNDVLALFPDVDPAHVDTLCATYSGPMALNTICNQLLEKDYPKKQASRSRPTTPTLSQSPKDTNVDYFKDYKSVNLLSSRTNTYINQAYTVLGNDFSWISGREIRKVMAMFGNHYAPSYQELALVWKQVKEAANQKRPSSEDSKKYSGFMCEAEVDADGEKKKINVKLLKNRRPVTATKKNIIPELMREIDFVNTKLAELAKEADLEVARQLNEQEYEDEGQCIECGCCYGEYPFEGMIQCSEGHLFCQNCLKQYAKEAVYGQGKADLKCMTEECDASFPKSQLEKALPSEMLAKYEDRVQEENINLADLGDLVGCPHCDFKALLDPWNKVFTCMKCGKATCRHCKENWDEHFGKRCEEIEKKDETKIRLAYEEKMTQAKVRTCHKCKAQFTKDDGCNKMTCRCGAKMCYICRQPNIDYNHFCRHVRDPGKDCTSCKACSLWTNPEEDDNRAVKEIQKEAEEKRKEKGFTEERLIGAPDEPPVKKARR